MVTPIDAARKTIQEAMVHIAGLPFFEKKSDVMSDLLELEWNLREFPKEIEEDIELAEFHQGQIEEPWSD
jgi:hypothetical protein